LGGVSEVFYAPRMHKFNSLISWASKLRLVTQVRTLDEIVTHKGIEHSYELTILDLTPGNAGLFEALDLLAIGSGFKQREDGWYYIKEDKRDGNGRIAKERAVA